MEKGPGLKLLSPILGIADFVIAEDLGMAGDDAIRLRTNTDYMACQYYNLAEVLKCLPITSTASQTELWLTQGRTTMIPSEVLKTTTKPERKGEERARLSILRDTQSRQEAVAVQR